jgi:hypothetical protein
MKNPLPILSGKSEREFMRSELVETSGTSPLSTPKLV